MRKWLNQEREFNHEVRKSHVVERFKFEAEYERDKLLVLQQCQSVDFKPATLERVSQILSNYQVINQSKRQDAWSTKVILQSIGGRIRAAQRLSAKATAMDEVKAKLSWQTSDWFQQLGMRGNKGVEPPPLDASPPGLA